jgi:hypothetical protein
MHDYFYDAGWNEISGNPQRDNLGRGGIGSDAIKGEAQDYERLEQRQRLDPGRRRAPAHSDVPVDAGCRDRDHQRACRLGWQADHWASLLTIPRPTTSPATWC